MENQALAGVRPEVHSVIYPVNTSQRLTDPVLCDVPSGPAKNVHPQLVYQPLPEIRVGTHSLMTPNHDMAGHGALELESARAASSTRSEFTIKQA